LIPASPQEAITGLHESRPGLPTETRVSDLLRERWQGSLEGKSESNYKPETDRDGGGAFRFGEEGNQGESVDDLADRVTRAVQVM
jgi:broad specificity phosphatase PhoE